MLLNISTITISFLILALKCSASFHVYLEPQETKCFYKDLSKESFLQAKYKVEMFDNENNQFVTSTLQNNDVNLYFTVEEVFDNNHRVASQKGSNSGDFTFTALDSGSHKICFSPEMNGYKLETKTKITVDFEIGDSKLILKKIENDESNLNSKVKKLQSKLVNLKKEYELFRSRESDFRDLSEYVNNNVVRLTFVQLIVLAVTCYWQLTDLSKFFVKQKVV